MKLRIKDHSLRLRLTQSEVIQIESLGVVTGTMPLPGAEDFLYVLESGSEDNLKVSMENNRLVVSVSKKWLNQWCQSQQVGIEYTIPLPGKTDLSVLIEKDFTCLNPRTGEDESDNFPNPAALPGM